MDHGRKNAVKDDRGGEDAEMAELKASLDSTIKLLQFTRLRNHKEDDNTISLNFRIDTTVQEEKKMEEVKRKVGEELTKIDSFLQRHTSLHYPSLLSLHAISDRHKRDLRKMAPTMQQMKDKVRKAQNDVDNRKEALLASLLLRMHSFAREAFLHCATSANQVIDQLRITMQDIEAELSNLEPSSQYHASNNSTHFAHNSQQESEKDGANTQDMEGDVISQLESFEEILLPESSFLTSPEDTARSTSSMDSSTQSQSHITQQVPIRTSAPESFESILSDLQGRIALTPSLVDSLKHVFSVEKVVALLSKAVRGVKRFLFLKQRAIHLAHLTALLSRDPHPQDDTTSTNTTTPPSGPLSASNNSTARTGSSLDPTAKKLSASSSNTSQDAFDPSVTHVAVLEDWELEIKSTIFPSLLSPLEISLSQLLSVLDTLDASPRMDESPSTPAKNDDFLPNTKAYLKIKSLIEDTLACYVSIGGEGDFAEVLRRTVVEPKFISKIVNPNLTSTPDKSSSTIAGSSPSIPSTISIASTQSPALGPWSHFDPSKSVSSSVSPSAPIQDQPLWKHLFAPFLAWSRHSLVWRTVQEVMRDKKFARPFLHAVALSSPALVPIALPSPLSRAIAGIGEVNKASGGAVGPVGAPSGGSSNVAMSINGHHGDDQTPASPLHHSSSHPSTTSHLPTSYAESARTLFKEASDAASIHLATGDGPLAPQSSSHVEFVLSSLQDSLFGAHSSTSHLVSLLTIQSWRRQASSTTELGHNTSGIHDELIPSSRALQPPTSALSATSTASSSSLTLNATDKGVGNALHGPVWIDSVGYGANLASSLSTSPFHPLCPSHSSAANASGGTGKPSTPKASAKASNVAWFSASSISSCFLSSLAPMLKAYLSHHRTEEIKVIQRQESADTPVAMTEARAPSTSRAAPLSASLSTRRPAFFALLSESEFATLQGMSETAFFNFLVFICSSPHVYRASSPTGSFCLRLPRIMVEGVSIGDWIARDALWSPFCSALALSSTPITSSLPAAANATASTSAGLPSLAKTLFSAGLPPPLLRRNLLLFSRFLDEFESILGSNAARDGEGALKSVLSLRTHPAANPSSWHLPWNVAGFVSLFTKQIIESFDETMSKEMTRVTLIGFASPASSIDPSAPQYRLNIFNALGECLERIWTPTAWIESLAHRFLKLSLQSFIHFSLLTLGPFDPLDQSSDTWIVDLLSSDPTSVGASEDANGEATKPESAKKPSSSSGVPPRPVSSPSSAQSKLASSPVSTKPPPSHASFLRSLLLLHRTLDASWHREATEAKSLHTPALPPTNALHVLLLLLQDFSALTTKMKRMEAYWSRAPQGQSSLAEDAHHTSSLEHTSDGYLLSHVLPPPPPSPPSSVTTEPASTTALLGHLCSKALSEGVESAKILFETRFTSLIPLIISHSDSYKDFGTQMKDIGQKYRFGGTGVSNPDAPSIHLATLFSTFLPLFQAPNPIHGQFEASIDWMPFLCRIPTSNPTDNNTEDKNMATTGTEATPQTVGPLLLPRHPVVIPSLHPLLVSVATSFLSHAKTLLQSAHKTQAFLDRKKKTTNPATATLLTPEPSPLPSLAPSPSPISPSLSPLPVLGSQSHAAIAALPFPSVPAAPLPDHAKLLLQLMWDAHFFAKASFALGISLPEQLNSIFQVLHDPSALGSTL